MSQKKKLQMDSWREPAEPCSQIGQLLYYMVGVQLRRLQLFLAPNTEDQGTTPPSPLLGVYMEEGMVQDTNWLMWHIFYCSVLIQITCVVALACRQAPGAWKIRLLLGEARHFADGALVDTVRLVQQFMSADY